MIAPLAELLLDLQDGGVDGASALAVAVLRAGVWVWPATGASMVSLGSFSAARAPVASAHSSSGLSLRGLRLGLMTSTWHIGGW